MYQIIVINFGRILNYEKLVTITTLTTGIGASLLGTTSNAHAEENTQNIQNNAQYNTSNQQSYSTETTSMSSTSGNLYTAGQCTWYVFDKVGGQIGSTWEMLTTGLLQLKHLVTQLITHLKKVLSYNHLMAHMVTSLM